MVTLADNLSVTVRPAARNSGLDFRPPFHYHRSSVRMTRAREPRGL
jgi:hypothetical protein